jgi:beta-galactosidase
LIVIFAIAFATAGAFAQGFPRKDLRFCDNWKFYLGDATNAEQVTFSDASWDTVCVPHTAHLESAKSHGAWDYYQGYYWYRKSFIPDTSLRNKKVFLEFEAVMQTTSVYLNGTLIYSYLGGYNPFTIDITGKLNFGTTNVIAVRSNNSVNSSVSPGNPQPDFYYFGGIYRYVNLHVTDSLHITDAVYANTVAGGGVFVTYPSATTGSASVQVKTQVINECASARSCVLTTSIIDSNGTTVQTASTTQSINAGANFTFTQTLTVANPRLWSPSAPNLYKVLSQVYDNTRPADQMTTTIGIRRIAFSRTNGLQINGVKLIAKGVNRHQDYGAIGNAVPVSGQYRDALRMKEAGVNYVRLSHYLQHPAFLDACDKLGITVEASLVGWQWTAGYSNATFAANLRRDLRTMIRYYRNHPSIVMWESVMNESSPPADFCDSAQAIAHAEYPGDQMFTAGQEYNNTLDIFQAAVQQGGRTPTSSKPCAISEYGHWEYGGFTGTSQQPRSAGENGMLTLAGNQADAMSQDHALSWLSVDAVWVYNEYFGFNQYANSLCAGGIVDVFRIPKFGYYFYQSQRDPSAITMPGVSSGPMVYIANFWTSSSTHTVRVYSNCAQVSLYLNGTLVATKLPDTYANIERPPFTFTISAFAAGTLRADGLIGGVVRATHSVQTPLAASKVVVTIDTANTPLVADGSDLAIVYGSIADANGTVMPAAVNPVTFSVSGPGKIISGDGNPVTAVAGIAAVYVQTKYNNPGLITVTASAANLTSGSATVRSVSPSADITAIIPAARVAACEPRFRIVQQRHALALYIPADASDTQAAAKFSLYNAQGRLMRAWTLATGKKASVNIAHLSRGVYYGRLTINGREYVADAVPVTESR